MKMIIMLRSPRIYYAISLIAAITLAAVMGGDVAHGIAVSLIILAGAAVLLAFFAKRQVLVRHKLSSSECVRGEEVLYAVQAQNKSFFPIAWCEMGSRTFSLRPFAAANHFEAQTPAHRGLYTFSVGSVRVSDPFRLANMNARLPTPLTLTVLPKSIPISDEWKQRLGRMGAGGCFSQISDEPAVEARAYRQGDSPRRIHWNLTARSRELMVRQCESVESRRVLVVLDLSPFSSDKPKACEDTLIEACLSVIAYALERQFLTTFIYAEGDQIRCFSGTDTRAFPEIRQAMAVASFDASLRPLQLLEDAGKADMTCFFSTTPLPEEARLSLPENIFFEHL